MWKLTLAIALATVLAPAALAEDAALAGRLDPVIEAAVAEEEIVGAVVLVARDGAVVYARAAGYADREAGRKMREDAVFRLSSVTKPIVSAAALALVDQGKLGLDDPVTNWIPEFRPKLPDGREPVITVRHLLTHTAGLGYGFLQPPEGPYDRADVSDGMDQPGLGIAENLRRLASVPLAYEPGTQWGYSLATDVLGEVIARAGGASLPEIVRQTVTGPLGMIDTEFVPHDPSRLAVPYVDGTRRPVRMRDPQAKAFGLSALRFSPSRALDPGSYPSGGAGMVGTAGDILTFLEAIRTGGKPILKPERARAMSHNAIGALPIIAGPGWGFGLGAAVLEDPAAARTPQPAGTWQWGGVYGHHWFVDPENRLTVVVLTNTAVAGMVGPFPDAVRNAVYDVQ